EDRCDPTGPRRGRRRATEAEKLVEAGGEGFGLDRSAEEFDRARAEDLDDEVGGEARAGGENGRLREGARKGFDHLDGGAAGAAEAVLGKVRDDEVGPTRRALLDGLPNSLELTHHGCGRGASEQAFDGRARIAHDDGPEGRSHAKRRLTWRAYCSGRRAESRCRPRPECPARG